MIDENSNELTLEKFMKFLLNISKDIQHEEVEMLFNIIDTDHSNSISYFKFNSYFKNLKH